MPTYPTDPYFSYPVVRRREFEARIITATNGTEQRWPVTRGRDSWDLTYTRLTVAQRDTLITFFEARHGSADLFDFGFLGTTYENCYFDDDALSFTEVEQGVIAASVKICQVTRVADSGSLAPDFPALTSGNPLQLPYTHTRSFDTVQVRTEGGRSAYSKRAASLRTWSAGGPMLIYDDALAIWNMFGKAQGRYRSFGFSDPDSLGTFTACRFGSDVIEWRMEQPGVHSVRVEIRELA